MSIRTLVVVAIRLMGLWYAVSALQTLVAMTGMLSRFTGISAPQTVILPSILAMPVAYGLAAAALFLLAPWLANRIIPHGEADREMQFHVGPGELYHIACFVLGLSLLVSTITPLLSTAAHGIVGSSAIREIPNILALAVTVPIALVLMFGSQKIGQFMANLRTFPDTIPKQQMTLGFLLAIVTCCAILLGVLRYFVLGKL